MASKHAPAAHQNILPSSSTPTTPPQPSSKAFEEIAKYGVASVKRIYGTY